MVRLSSVGRRSSAATCLLLVAWLVVAGCTSSRRERRPEPDTNSGPSNVPAQGSRGASPTASASPQGFQWFEDPEGHFSIAYPTDWDQQDPLGDGTVQVFFPKGHTNLGVVVTTPSTAQYPEFARAPRTQALEGFRAIRDLPGSRLLRSDSVRVDGLPGFSGKWLDPTKPAFLVWVVIVKGTDRAYQFRWAAPARSFNRYLPVVRVMMSTFGKLH